VTHGKAPVAVGVEDRRHVPGRVRMPQARKLLWVGWDDNHYDIPFPDQRTSLFGYPAMVAGSTPVAQLSDSGQLPDFLSWVPVELRWDLATDVGSFTRLDLDSGLCGGVLGRPQLPTQHDRPLFGVPVPASGFIAIPSFPTKFRYAGSSGTFRCGTPAS